MLALFVACTIYVQLRGKARLRWSRQLLDHSMFMAPYNALRYLFSALTAKLSNPVVRLLNRTLGRTIMRAAATQNEAGEPVGALNHLFSVPYQVRLLGKRLKQWHRPTCYAMKWTLVGWLVYSAIV